MVLVDATFGLTHGKDELEHLKLTHVMIRRTLSTNQAILTHT